MLGEFVDDAIGGVRKMFQGLEFLDTAIWNVGTPLRQWRVLQQGKQGLRDFLKLFVPPRLEDACACKS